jgi:parallel beta-helix repeat protein
MRRRRRKTWSGRGLIIGALVIGCLAVAAGRASADPSNYFVKNTGALNTGTCHNWATACTLHHALSLATTAGDMVFMKHGTYNNALNDVINGSDLGTDSGVTITGGYHGAGSPGGSGGVTTLKPPGLGGGNGIIDFSANSGITITKITVNSSAVSYGSGQAPVLNGGTGGSGDVLLRAIIEAGAPADTVALTAGSTTVDGVTTSGYTKDGILCSGSASCALEENTVSPITGTTTMGIEVGSGASATVYRNTISGNKAGGIVLDAAFGAIVNDNTLTANAGGGIVAEAPPSSQPGTPCTAGSEMSSPCQTYATDTVTNNAISGASSAGIELESMGGMSVIGNSIQTGDGGEGIVLMDSDNNVFDNNPVQSSVIGMYVGGNDLTGPSDGNTVEYSNMGSNEFGVVADGFGSPATWNRPGTESQGIQGEVFFQSSAALAGTITTACPDTFVPTCREVVTPTSFIGVPDAYSGVAEFLAESGAVCPASVPVDDQGGTLQTCTDGEGDIFLTGTVTNAISAGNGEATGPSPSSEPGCEANPLTSTGQPPCTGSVLTLSTLTNGVPTGSPDNTVAAGNTFNEDLWWNETVAGGVDGSGLHGQFQEPAPTYLDGNPDPASSTIQNTWTNNLGSESGSPPYAPSNPDTADPAAGI